MKNPVDDSKNQRSDKIRPYAANGDRHTGQMYTIHNLDGQPKYDDIDDKTEQPSRKDNNRKRKQFHQRLHESIENPDNDASHHKKHPSAGVLKIGNHFCDGKKRQTVEYNAEKNFFNHKVF